jgi:hypothetical protein
MTPHYLNLIYNYSPLVVNSNIMSHYQILYFFSSQGNLDKAILEKVAKSMENSFAIEKVSAMRFNSLDDLGHFALSVAQELQSPGIYILSAEDFNAGFETCHDLLSFRDLFSRFATKIENSAANKEFHKKRSLFFWNK